MSSRAVPSLSFSVAGSLDGAPPSPTDSAGFAEAAGSAQMIVGVGKTAAEPFVPWDASGRWVDGTVTHRAQ